MGNLMVLDGKKPKSQKPDEEIISIFERILADARAGKIDGFVLATKSTESEDALRNMWMKFDTHNIYDILGRISYIQRYLTDIIKDLGVE